MVALAFAAGSASPASAATTSGERCSTYGFSVTEPGKPHSVVYMDACIMRSGSYIAWKLSFNSSWAYSDIEIRPLAGPYFDYQSWGPNNYVYVPKGASNWSTQGPWVKDNTPSYSNYVKLDSFLARSINTSYFSTYNNYGYGYTSPWK
ncbi:hypothetical protein PV371_35675 [Streptomyces sp. TX20-6-3]|uniref:hypothetical protein n=1 Tax=Streptomyces sp. TX20-6-3 TaxID=3028705 RepID=UPI0029A8D0AC|nr:hypothetical protein [Streptomyces sp. TX20-6-3]MDX2564967.1 hypothetical protein [Streptomyces sp. TX20-6-3]